jgi:anaerobic magnesium-protoporphyrin IX monomethyl ester cyclase
MFNNSVVLIDWVGPQWAPGVFTKHSCLEPYGLECVGSAATDVGYNVEIIQPRHNSLLRLLSVVKKHNPFAVGISTKTYNLVRSLKLAKSIKSLNRNIYVILGGEHPTLCPDIIREDGIDFVIQGEGERAFVELLNALRNNKDISKINNIIFVKNDRLFINPSERILNLDNFPFALRDAKILKTCKQYGFSYPANSDQRSVAQISYSRGCPFNCSFCASPKIWNRQVVYRNPLKVVEEITLLKKKFNNNYIFFSDLTFNLNKDKTRELCNLIIKNRLNINWFCMCRPQKVDINLLQIMRDAGCSKIGWGIESLNKNSLDKIKVGQQYRMNELGKALRLSNSLGIINRGYLMIGYPWENIKDLKYTFNTLKRMPIDELKVAFFTPFPGTSAFQTYKNRMTTEDPNRFTTDEPVVSVQNIGTQELINLRKKLVKDFYLSEEYRTRMKDKINCFPYLKPSYAKFTRFLHQKGIIN